MSAHVLMLSSSRAGSEDYLEHAKSFMFGHLGDQRDILFIPFAGVTMTWDAYTQKVKEALPEFSITGLHTFENPAAALNSAKANNQAILVGGGNTFNLLHTLYKQNLLDPLKAVIADGTPYIGWSAGSNICGQSIRTTNDMPIVEPASFDALGVIQCQLNPHYSNYAPPGHNGETRDQRLAEFTTLHPQTPIIAIPEGTALSLTDGRLTLLGDVEGFVFLGEEKTAIQPTADLSQYIS
ncbi:dipeptidase PepE [Salinimonas sp. HHU 13199]|uniref:Dipeptidase PepE n=1 Tax=Salinimonas profundi TaxID=2729140 RepID=A0ABR8LIP4_9ALTE|nr:dipeptidase PepE [Salinimonas profundi]MBD3585088.1 dipeptidase PepE [Salinimonas profundi]